MGWGKLIWITERLEDPKHPLMGPILKGLYLFGLRQTGTKIRNFIYNLLHFFTIIFVISQFVDLYQARNDINLAMNNMSLTLLALISVTKTMSYVLLRKGDWKYLTEEISKLEREQINANDKITMKYLKEYIKYTRTITYLFWVLVFMTNGFLIISPYSKLVSPSFRESVRNVIDPLPQILSSWFPFDNTKMPGYLAGVFVHIVMSCQGSGVIAVYDMNAVAIMSYLKGQMIILREKCREIFDGDQITTHEILRRIKECHNDHNRLIKCYKLFNSLLSPTMFLYVLVCSITICTSVIQFTAFSASASHKLWIIQYTIGLITQLFIYCWHSNEMSVETSAVNRGVYESKWWKGDKKIIKQIHLLAAKLDSTLVLRAGPYTKLSVATFITILKGSYSFYTLFTKMQDNK